MKFYLLALCLLGSLNAICSHPVEVNDETLAEAREKGQQDHGGHHHKH